MGGWVLFLLWARRTKDPEILFPVLIQVVPPRTTRRLLVEGIEPGSPDWKSVTLLPHYNLTMLFRPKNASFTLIFWIGYCIFINFCIKRRIENCKTLMGFIWHKFHSRVKRTVLGSILGYFLVRKQDYFNVFPKSTLWTFLKFCTWK